MLNEDNLIAIIEAHRKNSLGYEDGELSAERATAMDHYHGRPYGNEVDGRSKVVSKDLSETVDWIMPQVMKMFLQSGNIVEFGAVGPEDEPLAEQESDYTNHVILNDNDGFTLLHDAFKDALLLKNGYWKHYADESEKVKDEEYEGLTEGELLKIFADLQSEGAEVEVKEQEVRLVDVNGQSMPVYDVKLCVTRKSTRIIVEAVPSEEIRVHKSCRGSLQKSLFVEHVTTKIRTDLLEMGMDEDFVRELPAHNGTDNDSQRYSRDSVSDESDSTDGLSYDRSVDEIEYCEAYLLVDWDGDGRAELRKVVTVANRIPPGDEWNESIECCPITGVVPKRVPHRHVGESLDDDIADLMEIKTVLTRQMLDNIYLTNNQEKIVNQRVHLPDMMQSLPGGIKRVLDDLPVQGAVEYIMTTPILSQILPAIDYINVVKSNRTGVNDANTGLDPDVLNNTTKGAYLENLRQSNHKIEMIARHFAEGVKELALRVHELIIRHSDKSRVAKLRGQYVEINPQEWRERTDLVVKVGLGTGSEEENGQKLALLAQGQEKLAAYGMVGPRQGYNMFSDMAKNLGYQNPEKYVLDPDSEEYAQFQAQMKQEQQQNPLAEAEQVKGQFKMQSDQMAYQFKGQLAQLQEQQKHQLELMKQQTEFNNAERDRQSREAIEIMKAEVQAFLSGMKMDIGQPGIGSELNV